MEATFKVPTDRDGHALWLGVEVKSDSYEFDSGTVSGYGLVDNRLCVRVSDIVGGHVKKMWCDPRKLVTDFVTVDGLLRDYVVAVKGGDEHAMAGIASKLEVKHGIV